MRINTKTMFIVLLLALFSNPLHAEQVVDDSQKPQFLFTLASKEGTFDKNILTLKDVPLVVYFSDRPVRKAGHISLGEFVSIWEKGADSFKNDPPNAELALFEKKSDKHAVVIISNPEVKGDTISFKVKIIGEMIPKKFEHSTLFIDVGIGMSGKGTF